MRGTDTKQPRCIALNSEVGESVSCNIYPLRSSTCHDCEVALVPRPDSDSDQENTSRRHM